MTGFRRRSIVWKRFLWGLLSMTAVGLGSCGGEGGSPTATNPISDGISGTRVATPPGQGFGGTERGRDPIPNNLLASFVISAEQWAAGDEVRIRPEQLTLCVDCTGLSPGDPSDQGARGLGSYEPEDLTVVLRIPEGLSNGTLTLETRFEVDSTTQFINPGQGVRLTVRRAGMVLDQDRIDASSTGDPLDFRASQITQGISNTQPVTLMFDVLSPLEGRDLHLEILLTSPIPAQSLESGQLALPPEGRIYAGSQGSPTVSTVEQYESAVGKPPAWVQFEQPWDQDPRFPQEAAQLLRQQGSAPYVRLILPPDPERLAGLTQEDQTEPWINWLEAIQALGAPVMVEIGQNNGDPELLRAVYRHLERLRQEQNILNLTWVYHLDPRAADPDGDYPGDAMISWINLKTAVETNPDGTWRSLSDQLDALYPVATQVSSTTPVMVTLKATPPTPEDPALEWVEGGLQTLIDRRWPRIRGLTWGWDPPFSEGLATQLKATLGGSDAVLGRVRVSSGGSIIQPLPSPTGGFQTPDPGFTPFPGFTPDPFFETEQNLDGLQ